METFRLYLPWIIGGIGAWSLINGVLHDIFVLLGDHGKQYDRNLLRLLMDGHVLITCGAILLLCFPGLKTLQPMAVGIGIACCLSLLVYCFMIWPFLKSVVTTTFSLAGVALLLIAHFTKP